MAKEDRNTDNRQKLQCGSCLRENVQDQNLWTYFGPLKQVWQCTEGKAVCHNKLSQGEVPRLSKQAEREKCFQMSEQGTCSSLCKEPRVSVKRFSASSYTKTYVPDSELHSKFPHFIKLCLCLNVDKKERKSPFWHNWCRCSM